MASETFVHSTAVVETGAELAPGVRVGPFCYVASDVRIGSGTQLIAHATVLGPTTLGENNRVFPYATLGAPPQDKSHRGEATRLSVGDDNEFREHVTVHRGTLKGEGRTRIGSRCLLMVGVHIAHDCTLKDDATLANLTTLGGHVHVERGVVTGGHVAIAPFVRLGRGCFLAGGARVERDVPPFLIAEGDRARIRGLNRVGLTRLGAPPASIAALKRAYRRLYRSEEPLAIALEKQRGADDSSDPWVSELIDFLTSRRQR